MSYNIVISIISIIYTYYCMSVIDCLMPSLRSQRHKLMEHVQNVCIQIGCEQQRLECVRVLVHLFIVHEEHLLQSAHRPAVPVRIKVAPIRIASHQVLRQDHYETLKHDQEQTFLFQICRLQSLLQLFHHLPKTIEHIAIKT